MIKVSCNLIEQKHTLVYNLKLCLELSKNAFLYLEINQSFIFNNFQSTNVPKTTQMDP